MSDEVAGGTRPLFAGRLALVLWNGQVGGAESLTVTLAQRLLRMGANVEVVFISHPRPLAARLSEAGVPYRSLGFRRGRDIAFQPRRYARGIAAAAPDGALLVARGLLGAALRCGGYRGAIVAVEHGELLELPGISWPRRLRLRVAGSFGARADDVEVGVSEYMVTHMRRHSHARDIRLIRNGIDPTAYATADSPRTDYESDALTLAFAGRLVRGKGADCAIRAVAKLDPVYRARLLIAGDGPERSKLEALAESTCRLGAVEFLGRVDSMPAFWRAADVVVVPPDSFTESFSMVTLEAMTCAKPIVATRNGAIPELITHGVTGTLIPLKDSDALARAITHYADRPDLRAAHGRAAFDRAVNSYHIDDCARAYFELFGELTARRGQR